MGVGDSEECMKVVVRRGCGGKARTEYEKGGFPDNERSMCPGEVVVKLGKSGTDSRVSGMVHKIDKEMGRKHTSTRAGEEAAVVRGASMAEERRWDVG